MTPRANRKDTNADYELLRRELEYFRREHDAIGARLLRLQEDQSRTARDARRSRTLATLLHDGHRLTERAATTADVAMMMTAVLVEDMLCDKAAILRRSPGGGSFAVLFSVGLGDETPKRRLALEAPPTFCFTTDSTSPGPAEEAIARFIDTPYILWGFDAESGHAIVIGNKTQRNVNRPFEAGDRILIDGALSVFTDVRRRKQQEILLRTAKLQAEQAGTAQTRFLAKLSHELRTPLNAILGFSELIGSAEERGFDVKRCVDYGDDIHEAGSYLLALINDILHFTAFGRHAPAIAEEQVDLNLLLQDLTETMRLAAEKKGVALELRPCPEAPVIFVDPVRIRQVTLNLLANGVKFTPAGGRVSLSASLDDATGAATIEVADTGVGLTAATAAEAFTPFYQAEDVIDYAGDGVGLGLTIAKELVEAHGGEITLRNAAEGGAIARITLPPSRTLSPARADPHP